MNEKKIRETLNKKFETISKETTERAKKLFEKTSKESRKKSTLELMAVHKLTLDDILKKYEERMDAGNLYPLFFQGLKKPEADPETKKELEKVKEESRRKLEVLGGKIRKDIAKEMSEMLDKDLSYVFLLNVVYNKFKWVYVTLMDEKPGFGTNKQKIKDFDNLAEVYRGILIEYTVLANSNPTGERKKEILKGIEKKWEEQDKIMEKITSWLSEYGRQPPIFFGTSHFAA